MYIWIMTLYCQVVIFIVLIKGRNVEWRQDASWRFELDTLYDFKSV